jgi:uncharacterized protein YbjQ (UPF0145 family)
MTTHHHLQVTTAQELEGFRVTKTLGVVRGIVVRSPGIKRGFVGAFRSLLAGNVLEYEEVCEQARAQAFERLLEHAAEVGADAVIAMRYDATEFMQGVAEVLAYGTAVKIAPA